MHVIHRSKFSVNYTRKIQYLLEFDRDCTVHILHLGWWIFWWYGRFIGGRMIVDPITHKIIRQDSK